MYKKFIFIYLLIETFSILKALDEFLESNSASLTPPSSFVLEQENKLIKEVFRNRVYQIVCTRKYNWKKAAKAINNKYPQEVQSFFKRPITVTTLKNFYDQRYEKCCIQPFTSDEDIKLLNKYNLKIRIKKAKKTLKREFYLHLADAHFKGRKPIELKERVDSLLKNGEQTERSAVLFPRQFKSIESQNLSEVSFSGIIEKPVCNTPIEHPRLEEESDYSLPNFSIAEEDPGLICLETHQENSGFELYKRKKREDQIPQTNEKTQEAFPDVKTNLFPQKNPIDPLFYHPFFPIISPQDNPLYPGVYNNPFLFFYNPLSHQNLTPHNPFNPTSSFNTPNTPNFFTRNPFENCMNNLGLSIQNLSLNQNERGNFPPVPRAFPKL